MLYPSTYRSNPDREWIRKPLIWVSVVGQTSDTILEFDFIHDPPNPFTARGVVAVADSFVVLGRTHRPELLWFDLEGRLKRIVRWTQERQTPSDSLWEAYETTERRLLQRQGLSPSMVERILEPRRSSEEDELPLFGSVRGSATGQIWVGEWRLPGEASERFWVLSSEGEPLGRIDTPEGFRVLDIARNRVLGVQRDELHVERVAVYELIAGSGNR